MKCSLCEAGHVHHAHRVGMEAMCGECRKPGVVVATNEIDHDAALEKSVATPLEASCYLPYGVTCRECETGRLRAHFATLPKRGHCPACGKPKKDSLPKDPGFVGSFCDDACRSAWATKEAGQCGPT